MKRMTIKDIAKIAGVNHSTVSRSLNDHPSIPAETRDRIKQIARENNFEYDVNAQGLKRRKSGVIGMIFTEGFDDPVASTFFIQMLHIIRKRFTGMGFDTIIDVPRNPITGESQIQRLIASRRIEGMVITDSSMTESELKYIISSGIPSVFLHHKLNFFDRYKINYIAMDNYNGGKIAAKYFIKCGHRKIITVTYDRVGSNYYEFFDRTKGFLDELENSGISRKDIDVLKCDISFNGAYKLTHSIRERISDFTAVFAQTDLVAFGVIRALKEIGLNVPEDISVIGYDDIPYASYYLPALTTVRQPVDIISEEGCSILIKNLNNSNTEENKNITKKIISPVLVERESCRLLK